MEIIDWILVNASSSVYFLFPLAVALFGIYKAVRYFFPKKDKDKFGLVEGAFIPIFLIGFFFIETYPNYSFMNKIENRAAIYPNERLFVVNKSVSFNPISWFYDQVSVYHTVAPLPADPMTGTPDYNYNQTRNDFYLNVAVFDNDEKTSKISQYWLEVDCDNKVQQINKVDEEGTWRIINPEYELGEFEINRYCKTDYSEEFLAYKCMQGKIDEARELVQEIKIDEIALSCR